MGNPSISSSSITKDLPVKVGTQYEEDIEKWSQWCEAMRVREDLLYADCSSVRYSNFEAFFVIDVVEREDDYRLKYRNAPAGSPVLPPASVMESYGRLKKRLWELFNLGNPPLENTDKGFLDYDDPQMHSEVLKLVAEAPKYRGQILEVLHSHQSFERRMEAADLLNWAGDSTESVEAVYGWLDDPHYAVRNQLSRFLMAFAKDVTDKSLRIELVATFLFQLERPSHGDRNKALYCLLSLATHHPHVRPFMNAIGGEKIRVIAAKSILSNVKEPAEELLKLLEE